MNALTAFDIFLTFSIGLFCWIGIFSSMFRDNLLQRLGMAIIAIAYWGRSYQTIEFGPMPPLVLWIHLGIFFFALGTCWRFVWVKYQANHCKKCVYNRREADHIGGVNG